MSAPSGTAPREIDASERERLAVDGMQPRLFVAPESAEDVARLLGWAAEERLAVAPRGGGTRTRLGNIPRAVDMCLSTEKLDRVLEYEPSDLTITVQSGIKFAELQRVLSERGQFLPLDPEAEPDSTIGGIIATNASGPLRLRYGTPRDLLIGTQTANASGDLSRAGGKVVKNVTGYDLNKLYIGSYGTIGVMTELTFKLAPIPETTRTLVATFASAESANRTVYRVIRSPLTPSALEVLSSATGDSVQLIAHIGGFAKPVDRHILDLTLFANDEGAKDIHTVEDAEAVSLWQRLRAGPRLGERDVRLRLSVPISQTAWAFEEVESTAGSHGLTTLIQASAGVGVLRVALSTPSGATGDVAATIRRLRARVREHLGTLVIESCPLALKSEFDVFGDTPDGFEIMRRLKNQFDPVGILNPGRFLGRL